MTEIKTIDNTLISTPVSHVSLLKEEGSWRRVLAKFDIPLKVEADRRRLQGSGGSSPRCLFEDHFFNTKTKAWEPIDASKGLRRCLHSKCTRKHKLANRPVQVCKRENDCPDAGVTCFLLHDNTKLEPLCRWGINCVDKECTGYRHPRGRSTEVCVDDENCKEALINCFKLHTMSKMIPLCHYKADCINYICQKRHPPGRKEVCEDGSMCWLFITGGQEACDKLHPKILQKACRWSSWGGECRSYGCPFVHKPGEPVDCPVGMQCSKRLLEGPDRCSMKHPKYNRVTTLPGGELHFD